METLSPLNTRLSPRLSYLFKDSDLLARALTHRSAASKHNERLEFLGDSILDFIIGEALYQKFPEAHEGELTRMRAALVKGDTLAKIALELELGPFLQLGAGELKSGGRQRPSILADAVEALIGAIYLDGGMADCRESVLALYHERLVAMNDPRANKDPKTRLQEWLQARNLALPIYRVAEQAGSDHQRQFLVECQLPHVEKLFRGSGSSRRKAEQSAANQAIGILNND